MTLSNSAFGVLTGPPSTPKPGLRGSILGALDGCALSIPSGLGAVALVFSHVGLEFLPAGIAAYMLAMVVLHLVAARSARPLLYSARFFEAATLAALMDQVAIRAPAWGLPDTPGVRLAFLCLIGGAAAITVGLLYLARADRFTRFIPAPVFAGFANSIALALVVSQSEILWNLLTSSVAIAPVVTVSAITLATGVGLRWLRPRWPGMAIALAVGLVLGLAWAAAGRGTPSIGSFGWVIAPPLMLADFRALVDADVLAWPVASAIVTSGAILGVTMFINTTLAAQVMTRRDGLRSSRARHSVLMVAGMALGGLLGSAPLSGLQHASVVAARPAGLTPSLMLASAVIVVMVYLTGVIGLIPLAAVCGTLLCEAWLMADRPSLALMGSWLRRRTLTVNGRDDLILIVAVMASSVLLNMVAAVFIGLLFGLVLFAARNARRPVRHVWSGLQVMSNCARSRADLALLSEHGGSIRVMELEADLFFGATESLDQSLYAAAATLGSVVIDWSRVRHMDSSVVLSIERFERLARERSIATIHAGTELQAGNVAMVLRQHVPGANFAPDLDRALELAENHLIQLHGTVRATEATAIVEAAALLHGLDDVERACLEAGMAQRLYRAGDVMLEANQPGDELMLVLHGTASIVVRLPGGQQTRLAGARRGATLGEIAFLDRAVRSATVIAEEDTTVAVLERSKFDELCVSHPKLVQRLLSNIAVSLAARLRHSNQLALTRQGNR